MRLYKAIIAFSLIILFPFFLLSRQKYISDNDGTDWMNSSRINKVGFIEGFISGTSLMNEQAIQKNFNLYKKKKDKPITSEGLQIDWALGASDALSLYGISVGQLTDGVDAFYNDFTTRKIKVIDAIYIVKNQINGADPDYLSAHIRYLKLQPINPKELNAIINKVYTHEGSVSAAYNAGSITSEELLKFGFYLTKDKQVLSFFCYGDY